MWVITRIKIGKNERTFFSVGPMELLEKIEVYSSIKKATAAMGMSYTKALKLIHIMERELGFAVVLSKKGGSSHGMTRLTPKGRQVLNTFQEINADVSAYAERLVSEKFNF